jgi:hypothetical protein
VIDVARPWHDDIDEEIMICVGSAALQLLGDGLLVPNGDAVVSILS